MNATIAQSAASPRIPAATPPTMAPTLDLLLAPTWEPDDSWGRLAPADAVTTTSMVVWGLDVGSAWTFKVGVVTDCEVIVLVVALDVVVDVVVARDKVDVVEVVEVVSLVSVVELARTVAWVEVVVVRVVLEAANN